MSRRHHLFTIKVLILAAVMLAGSLVAVSGQRGPGSRNTPFEKKDKNKDGKLTFLEFNGPRHVFDRLDTNRDGFISRQEARAGRGVFTGKAAQTPSSLIYIDTHNHFQGFIGPQGSGTDFEGALQATLAAMDKYGVKTALMMPTPQTTEQVHKYDATIFTSLIKKHPQRFAFLAGGGTLSPMIMEAQQAGTVTDKMRSTFKKKALEILSWGACGFGEMTAEHLSFNPKHPYISAPPDHPLFLLLADIAAEHDVPIDLHMESVPKDVPLPQRLKSPPNPKQLKANIAAFERLLTHNPKAKIVWVHLGWDNTGYRSVELTSELMKKYPNLYMSFRITPLKDKQGQPHNRPVDEYGNIKPEWLALVKAFPDRFLFGSDEFFLTPQMRMKQHPSTGSMEATVAFLNALPPDLSRKVGCENAKRIYKLK